MWLFISHTSQKFWKCGFEDIYFSSVSAIISVLLTSSDNWLNVLPSTPNILGNLKFENDDILDKINLEEFKNEHKNDSVIKPIYRAVVSDSKFGKKTKVILNYWNKLKLNRNGIWVKRNSDNKQLLFPKKYYRFIFRELHENMGHLGFEKAVELVK